jgi:hypothetical protein
VRAVALAAAALLVASQGCHDNILSGNVRPVPPVHRVPFELQGRSILVGEDADIESKDPVHLRRARDRRIPQDLRAAMARALSLAGFRVVTARGEPHDLEAKLALAVREEPGHVYQTYRCGLRSADGALVAQFDWAWPEDTYVEESEVFDYATHTLATEIATSRRVWEHLGRAPHAGADGGAPGGAEGGAGVGP